METKEVEFHAVTMDDISAAVVARVRQHELALIGLMLDLRELLVLRSAFPNNAQIGAEIQTAQMEVLALHIRIKQCAPQHDIDGVPLAFNAQEATIGWPVPEKDTEPVDNDDRDNDDDIEYNDNGAVRDEYRDNEDEPLEVTAVVQPDTTSRDEQETTAEEDVDNEIADVVPIVKTSAKKTRKVLAKSTRTTRS